MLPSLFAANYELRHIAAEDVIFILSDGQTNGDPAKLQQARVCHIDAAYGGKDCTAFTVCQKSDGKYYVFGKLWNKHVDLVLDEIIAIRKRFNAGRIYMETNADKGYLAKALRKRGERCEDYAENTNKYHKIVTYLYEAWKDVVFVAGTDTAYIRQVTDYTEEAEHDDAPDSLASSIRVLYQRKDKSKERNWA